jgi:hypothetical protein
MKNVLDGIEGLEPEDSTDFTQEDALKAVPTRNQDHMIHCLIDHLRSDPDSGFSVKSHELRRCNNHLYYRVRLVTSPLEPDKVLIYQVDWIVP